MAAALAFRHDFDFPVLVDLIIPMIIAGFVGWRIEPLCSGSRPLAFHHPPRQRARGLTVPVRHRAGHDRRIVAG